MSDWRDSLNRSVADDETARQKAADQRAKEQAQERTIRGAVVDHINTVILPALEELRQELNKSDRTLGVRAKLENYTSPNVEVTISRPGRDPFKLTLMVHTSPTGSSVTIADESRSTMYRTGGSHHVEGGIEALTKEFSWLRSWGSMKPASMSQHASSLAPYRLIR